MKYRIRALKYGNLPHYEWDAEALKITEDYIVLRSERGRELTHHTKGKTFVIGHAAVELFSLKEGYTASFDVRDGVTTHVYCNVALPSTIEGNTVSFVDLDLDLLFDGEKWFVADEDEFEDHRRKFGYPEALVDYALAALRDLRRRVEEGAFPFDGALDAYVEALIEEKLPR